MDHSSDSDIGSDSGTITPLDYHNPPTLLGAAEIVASLEGVAREAIETEDYLYFATFVEIQLYDSRRFDDSMRNEIMIKLDQVLHDPEYTILASKIGWDLPPLLLKYIESSYEFKSSLFHAPCVTAITSMMNLIARDNDPKVLFVLSLDMASQLDFYLNGDIDYSIKATERFFDLKFHLILELLRSSINRVVSDHPSKLLTRAFKVMLEFLTRVTPKLTIFSISIILRRFYSFVRDYRPGPTVGGESLPHNELGLVRALLRNLLSHVVAICLSNISVRWSVRVFIELKHNVLDLPLEQRAQFDDVASSGSQVVDILMRYAQLMLSMDMEPQNILEYFRILPFEEFVKEYNNNKDNNSVYDPMRPSLDGLLILVTQYTFDEHPERLEVTLDGNVMDFTYKFIMSRSKLPTAIRDAIGFWGWWTIISPNKISMARITVNGPPLLTFKQYLHILSMITNPSPTGATATGVDLFGPNKSHNTIRKNTPTESKVKYGQVMTSLIGRLLTLREGDDAWSWLLEVLTEETGKSEAGRIMAINMLSVLTKKNKVTKTGSTSTTQSIPSGTESSLVSSLAAVSLSDNQEEENNDMPHVIITPERASQLLELLIKDIERAVDINEPTQSDNPKLIITKGHLQTLIAWLKLTHSLLDLDLSNSEKAQTSTLNYNGILKAFEDRGLIQGDKYAAEDMVVYRGMVAMLVVLEKKIRSLPLRDEVES